MGAYLGQGSEVRVHATIHRRTRLQPATSVSIGWIAVGDPPNIPSQDCHDDWVVRKPLNFPQWVYGIDRNTPDLMVHVMRRLSELLRPDARQLGFESVAS